jgi:hypothetical protein
MRALSILQPYAWAIAKGHKPVENRDWPPPKYIIGQRIAIHASKKVVGEDGQVDFESDLTDFGIEYPEWEHMPYGAIVATALVKGFVTSSGAKTLPRNAYRWFTGTFGWLLDDIIELPEPVPARGMLGLWTVPLDVETLVLQRLVLW